MSYYIISAHIISYHIISHYIVSYHIISHCIISYHLILFTSFSRTYVQDKEYLRALVLKLSPLSLKHVLQSGRLAARIVALPEGECRTKNEDMNAFINNGFKHFSTLQIACMDGKHEIVERLLDSQNNFINSVDVNKVSDRNHQITALYYA